MTEVRAACYIGGKLVIIKDDGEEAIPLRDVDWHKPAEGFITHPERREVTGPRRKANAKRKTELRLDRNWERMLPDLCT